MLRVAHHIELSLAKLVFAFSAVGLLLSGNIWADLE